MRNRMLVSIVIPTRERAEVLRYALASCTRIVDSQIEIIVSDNASLDDTAEVVAAKHDDRIRYVRTPRRCSMRENFEFGVNHARGDYVFVMGDDDALIPESVPLSAGATGDAPSGHSDWRGYQVHLAGRVDNRVDAGDRRPRQVVVSIRLRASRNCSRGAVAQRTQAQWSNNQMGRAPYLRRDDVAPRHRGAKGKVGQLFMGSSPDVYVSFAAPSVIERHLVVKHPFFIGAASTKSNGANFRELTRAAGPGAEYKRFLAEVQLDSLVDPIPLAPSAQIDELSLLEAANRYVYDGAVRIDYEREFERAIRSLRDVEESHRNATLEALAHFASERDLPSQLCDASYLASRCEPFTPAPRAVRRETKTKLCVLRPRGRVLEWGGVRACRRSRGDLRAPSRGQSDAFARWAADGLGQSRRSSSADACRARRLLVHQHG